MSFVVDAQSLRKSYGSLTAVKDVTLRLSQGECLALLGPNGAGKTTTVEMLEGLVKPDSGSITIFGLALKDHHRTILERVGVLLQDSNLYKKLTVRETLDLFASFYKDPLNVEEVIAQMRLEEKANARLEQLSGGLKQRVYIGCALINRPKLIFLDEPTTGLDPQARRNIWELIGELKKQGCSVLLTTHYMEEAEQLADQVAVIDHGTIIAQESPSKLIKNTCGSQLLFVEVEGLTVKDWLPEVEEKLGSQSQGSHDDDGAFFPADDPIKAVVSVSKIGQDMGLNFRKLELRRSTLEDVFLTLTGRHIRDQ